MNKFLNDLKEWGVEIDPMATYSEVKLAHQRERKKRKAANIPDEGPMVPHVNLLTEDMSPEDLKAAVVMLLKERRENRGGGFSKEELTDILRSSREDKINDKGQVNPAYVNPNDVIPTVQFFAPYVRYFVLDKYNGAYSEALPMGISMLKFDPAYAYTVQAGDRKRRQYMSILETSSHSVYKYLTGEDIEGEKVGVPHSDFNRVFYLHVQTAMDNTGTGLWAQCFKKHESLMLMKRTDELYAMLRKYGKATDVTVSRAELAATLAEELANREMQTTNEQQQDRLRQGALQAAMLKNDGINVGGPRN